ncbi:thiamine phosphate synthase [Jeotgalibacillus marinus]|uniref:Thiamine-phosphate synthase n=1 Tax=Jeotgalibacillus marinus TaxID=86667 RepID=A0ABV3Q1X2_9BACL
MNLDVKNMLRRYLVMGSQNCVHEPEETLKQAIAGGITAFQYREKGQGALVGQAKEELGWRLRRICKKHDVPFFINDDIELVESLEVDGIHVGQDDHHVDDVRRKHPDKIIGLSVSTIRELERSPIHQVDYLGAGPVFPTLTKVDAKRAVGIEWITTIKKNYPTLPIVGIGGIDQQNAASVLKAGAEGIAVISAITHAINIEQAVRNL